MDTEILKKLFISDKESRNIEKQNYKRKISSFHDILCNKLGCKKVIGYKFKNRSRYFNGTWQYGFKSFCSKKHLFT